jgi:clan AA aspartic protease (TIGR02281 family)
MKARLLLALLALAPGLALAACKLARITEWTVQSQTGRLIVEGALNGQPIGVLLDTGAQSSMMTRSAADRLGLTRHEARGYRAYGIGGETHVEYAVVDELKIGDASRRNMRVMVLGERDFGRRFSFLLGYDFFEHADIEFDLANNAVRVFQPQDCGDAWLGYWAPGATGAVPLESDSVKAALLVNVKLNGRTFVAEIDTGAAGSLVSRQVAALLGITPDTPGVVAAGKSGGLGAGRPERSLATFESFAIGDEVIRSPSIAFTNLEVAIARTGSRLESHSELRDMLLGVDFLRAHRVYVAQSQKKLYFTYAGGRVFAPPPAPPSAPERQQ